MVSTIPAGNTKRRRYSGFSFIILSVYASSPSVAAPTLNAGDGRTSVVIHSAPVFHVGNDAQAQDIEEMLRRHDEELLDEIDERERQRQDDERRRNYD